MCNRKTNKNIIVTRASSNKQNVYNASNDASLARDLSERKKEEMTTSLLLRPRGNGFFVRHNAYNILLHSNYSRWRNNIKSRVIFFYSERSNRVQKFM